MGQRIRQARRDKGWSQSQLAQRIGAHPTSVSDWERGINAPSSRHLIAIAEATDKPLSFFAADGDDDEEDDLTRVLYDAAGRIASALKKAAVNS